MDFVVSWWMKDHLFGSGLNSRLIRMLNHIVVIIIIIRDRGLFDTSGAQALADIFRIC